MTMQKKLFILTLIFGIIGFITIAAFIVLETTDILLLKEYRFLAIILCIFTPIIVAAFFLSLMSYLAERSSVKELRSENKYNLGIECVFYNYNSFEKTVNTVRRHRQKGKESWIIAFSASNQSVVTNAERNEAVTRLNGLLAVYLSKNYTIGGKKDLDVAYCFYHGLFILCVFGDETRMRNVISDMDSTLYETVENEDIKVFAQPYFGVYPLPIDRHEELFISLDNAITARSIGERNFETITYYSPSFRTGVSKSEIDELSEALKNDEFVVYYQPKFHLISKTFVSSEALIRWDSKKYGLISPAKFINKAEVGGLIHDLDMFVFRRVCEDLYDNKKKGKKLLPVSVNFSLYEFYSPSFVNDVMDILNSFDLNPSLIEIEITETTSQANSFLSVSILKKLRETGLRILMDDFGIGYSNVSNLKKLPIDTIKIDRTFIENIVDDLKSREIVRFLINLCKVNDLEVIAEGVDDAGQVEILKKLKCDTIQGYFYSKPLSRADFEKFLASNNFERRD